jgi:hypothetical protein
MYVVAISLALCLPPACVEEYSQPIPTHVRYLQKARKDNKRRKALQEKAAEAQRRKEELVCVVLVLV